MQRFSRCTALFFLRPFEVMPRAPQFVHPFRVVRDIMGLNQGDAAEILGISRSALQQIERGVLPLSEEIATRMLLVSGAKIPTGLCRETIEPIAWDNSPYDSKTLEVWNRYVLPYTAAEKFLEKLDADLRHLVHSAWEKGCHFPLMWAIQTALADHARNFGVVEFLEAETLARLFGSLVDRAHASGIELEDAFKMAQPAKASGSKRKRRGQP